MNSIVLVLLLVLVLETKRTNRGRARERRGGRRGGSWERTAAARGVFCPHWIGKLRRVRCNLLLHMQQKFVVRGTSNIEHPTPNIEWQRESSLTSAFDVFPRLRFRRANVHSGEISVAHPTVPGVLAALNLSRR